MSGTDLILMALVAIIVGSYVFFICWLDKIYDQARHNFFFPNSKIEEAIAIALRCVEVFTK